MNKLFRFSLYEVLELLHRNIEDNTLMYPEKLEDVMFLLWLLLDNETSKVFIEDFAMAKVHDDKVYIGLLFGDKPKDIYLDKESFSTIVSAEDFKEDIIQLIIDSVFYTDNKETPYVFDDYIGVNNNPSPDDPRIIREETRELLRAKCS